MAMQEINALVDNYFAMWNEADDARRHALIETTWADDARYVDPMFDVAGTDGLNAMVVGVHGQFPGHRFRLVGPVDSHHDRARWDWELVGPDGVAIATGVDVAALAPDGRLTSVTGFIAQAPVAA